jgi:hypothetical protein
MKKEKPLSTKELIRMVASSSKYHVYEVEDVLSHAIAHIQEAVSKGKSVKLSGIGTLSRKLFKPRFVTLDGRPPVMVYNIVGMSVKLDDTMKQLLKENYDKTRADQ